MDALVTHRLSLTDLAGSDGRPDFDVVNAHVPSMDRKRRVSLLYYLVLIPQYLPLVRTLLEQAVVDIPQTTIEPDGICDPISFCHPAFIRLLWAYGFPVDIPRFRARFLEGVCSADVLRETFACIGDPGPFCSGIDYDDFVGRMVMSCLAAQSRPADVRHRVTEQYMLALAYLFRHSTRVFDTNHLNKLMTCRDRAVIERVLRFAVRAPARFNFRLHELCRDHDVVSRDISDLAAAAITAMTTGTANNN